MRPVILHAVGGVYLDHDVRCHKSVEPLLDGKTLVLRHDKNVFQFHNHFMASAPGHPYWDFVLRDIAKTATGQGATSMDWAWKSVVNHTGNGALGRGWAAWRAAGGDASAAVFYGDGDGVFFDNHECHAIYDATLPASSHRRLHDASSPAPGRRRLPMKGWRQAAAAHHEKLVRSCNAAYCLHALSVSPAEIIGEDDNAAKQLRQSAERNRKGGGW